MQNHPLLKMPRSLGFGLGLILCLLAFVTALPAEDAKKPADPGETAGKNTAAVPPGKNGTNATSGYSDAEAPDVRPEGFFDKDDDSPEAVAQRRKFLQKNFDKFVPMTFLKDTNSEAAIQYLNFTTNKFKYNGDGLYYFGFKFTAPDWVDGDFSWMFTMAKTEATKDFYSRDFKWYIIPETGEAEGFLNFYDTEVADFKDLKAKFPYTHTVFIQTLPRARLKTNRTYGIWFTSGTDQHPDMAFAMTIKSAQGRREFGELPLH